MTIKAMLCIRYIRYKCQSKVPYLHVFLDLLLLVSEFSEGINDQTYSNIMIRGVYTICQVPNIP